MRKIGPFYRAHPNVTTTSCYYSWCFLWVDEGGRTIAIEWL